jgi:hypothetical protein
MGMPTRGRPCDQRTVGTLARASPIFPERFPMEGQMKFKPAQARQLNFMWMLFRNYRTSYRVQQLPQLPTSLGWAGLGEPCAASYLS